MRAARRWFVPLALVLLATAMPVPARAEIPDPMPADEAKRREASERFERGLGLYREGNYGAALSEFKAAYDLSPSYKLLYNIGQVNYQLKDYVGALKAFEQYMKEGKDEVPPARKTEVDGMTRTLIQRVSTLRIVVNVEGASISVDDIPRGKSPLAEPIMVGVGRHRVNVTKQGYAESTRLVDLAGARTETLDFELIDVATQHQQPVIAPVPPPIIIETPKPVVEPHSKMTTLSWIGVGVSGALVFGAATTGILALGAKSSLDDKPPSDPGASDAQSRVKTLSIATDVLAGAAVATLGVTLALTFLRHDATSAPRGSSRAPRLAGAGVGPGSVSAMWEF